MELLSPWSESAELSDTIVGAVKATRSKKKLLKHSRCPVEVPEETVALEKEAAEARGVPEGAEAIGLVVVTRPLVRRRASVLPSVAMSSTMETKQPPINSRPRGRN